MEKTELLRWAIEQLMDAGPAEERFDAIELMMTDYRNAVYWENRAENDDDAAG